MIKKSCYGCLYANQPITKEPCYRCERVLTESGNYEDCYKLYKANLSSMYGSTAEGRNKT